MRKEEVKDREEVEGRIDGLKEEMSRITSKTSLKGKRKESTHNE